MAEYILRYDDELHKKAKIRAAQKRRRPAKLALRRERPSGEVFFMATG